LAQALVDAALPGLLVRPASFRPSFEKFAGEVCHGVMLHVSDARAFRPVLTYTTLLALAHHQAPAQFEFRSRAYEFETDKLAFDLLTGSSAAREAILAGQSPVAVADLIAPADAAWKDVVRGADALLDEAHA
jgi:uncharacterized protein YbbC (DUF1343 family)